MTAPNVEAFVVKVRKGAAVLNTYGRDVVFAVALAAKEDQLRAATATGVSGRLRGVGKNGAKVSVGFDIKGETNPTALVKWRGPAHLVNNPTKAHDIATRRRRGKRAALKLPDGYARHVHTRGTHGKHFFEAGVELTSQRAGKILQQQTHAALGRVFHG